MLNINEWSYKELRRKFKNRVLKPKWQHGSWQTSRCIQINIKGYRSNNIHYEYRIDNGLKKGIGRVELHFEGNSKDKYSVLINRLIDNTHNSEELNWLECGLNEYRCQHSKKIESIDDLLTTTIA